MPRCSLPLSFALRFVALAFSPLAAQIDPAFQKPSPALAALVDAPLTPLVTLSPDRQTLLLLDRDSLPALAELARPELRLAGIRLDPATNGPSRATTYTGISFQPITGGPARRVTGLPADAQIAHSTFSRDSRHLAFTLVRDTGLELWLADVPTAQARRLTAPILNAVFGEPFAWLDAATLVLTHVPADRPAAPIAPTVPPGPTIQENLGQKISARTFDGLLTDAHDETLFVHYGTAELALLSLDGALTPLPIRGLINSFAPSPDGRLLLVETLHRPFSYLVPASRFPVAIDVLDRTGRAVHRVADLPLAESINAGAVRPGPRGVAWRADHPATLSWAQALDRGEETDEKKAARDAWFTHDAPFAQKPVEQQRFEFRVQSVAWSDDTLALVTESWTRTRRLRTWRVAPAKPGAPPELLFDRTSEDRYADPGRPTTVRNSFGRPVLQRSAEGSTIFLQGEGASPEGDRPFLAEFDLTTKKSRRLWQSAPPHYEEFLAFTDATRTRALTARESATEPANTFLRDLTSGTLTPLTAFKNPHPQFNAVRTEVLRYRRADGVALSGTLFLPPGYTPADGPLPTLIWAYPREFLSADAAAQVKATPERFSRVSVNGPLPFLLAGYAVFNDPAMPIIAQEGGKPNDTYVTQLVANAQAAVEELARRGVTDPKRVAVGGHSYGAFMTANLLAHSRLFRAGIARSGAYNRTLTPFGFQSEQRTFWQAPAVYAAMSPFYHADKIKDPILLTHGEADNNSGTFPIQSERFYAALKSQGATTRLVLLPHESHGYRARENLLHVLWETERWLDTYVKPKK